MTSASTATDNRIRKHLLSADMRPILASWPASTPATVEAINPDADSAFTLRLDVLPGIFGGPLPALAWLRAGNLSPDDLARAAALLLPDGAPVSAPEPGKVKAARFAVIEDSFSTATHDFELWGDRFGSCHAIVRRPVVGSPKFKTFTDDDARKVEMFEKNVKATDGATEISKGALKVHTRGANIYMQADGGQVVWSQVDTGEVRTPLMGSWPTMAVNRCYLHEAVRLVGDKRVVVACGDTAMVVRGLKDPSGPVVVLALVKV